MKKLPRLKAGDQEQNVNLTLTLNPVIHGMLHQLVHAGLFGNGLASVAENLIGERLRDLTAKGWIGYPPEMREGSAPTGA